MVFSKYFFSRFFKYFLSLSILLAFIINFIEFFEKIVHVHTANLQTIFNFVILNFIPSFFDILPIASWLTSCLLIKEFYQQNEWESFSLLNVNSKVIIKLALLVGITTAIVSFVFRETFVERMMFGSEQYKMENFKRKSAQKIIGKWMEIAPDTFLYFGMLDFSTNSGTDFLILYLDSDFSIKSVVSGQSFEILPEKNEIVINSGVSFEVESNLQERFANKHMILPTFFSQVKINFEPATLFNLLKDVANKRILPLAAQRSLQQQIVNKVVSYLKLILYPTVTFALFITFWRFSILRWIVIFIPYPFFVGYSIISDAMASGGMNPWIFLSIYFLLLFIIYLIFFTKLFKKFS